MTNNPNDIDAILKEVLTDEELNLFHLQWRFFSSTGIDQIQSDHTSTIKRLATQIHKLTSELGKVKAENKDYDEILRKAHVLLDAVEPNNPVTEEIYNVITRYF